VYKAKDLDKFNFVVSVRVGSVGTHVHPAKFLPIHTITTLQDLESLTRHFIPHDA
jgi:hypothetical protein